MVRRQLRHSPVKFFYVAGVKIKDSLLVGQEGHYFIVYDFDFSLLLCSIVFVCNLMLCFFIENTPMIKVRVEEPREVTARVGSQVTFVCTATSKVGGFLWPTVLKFFSKKFLAYSLTKLLLLIHACLRLIG